MSRLIKIADWTGEKRGNVVFIHGLGGHPYNTWRRSPNDDSFWPKWLAEDVKGLSVYSFGYFSPPTNWLGTAMPLLDEAAHALDVLLASEDLKSGSVTFVCHSLGGLMAKSMIRAAREQSGDPVIADFCARIRLVVFIATPHTGSGKATLLEKLSWLSWPSASTRVLVANRPELRDLNFGYRSIAETRKDELAHLVYYDMLGGGIVSPASADPGLPSCRPTPIHADHITIAKPKRRDDLVYAKTKKLVAQLAPEPPTSGDPIFYHEETFKDDFSWKRLIPNSLRVCVLLLAVYIFWIVLNHVNNEINFYINKKIEQKELEISIRKALSKLDGQNVSVAIRKYNVANELFSEGKFELALDNYIEVRNAFDAELVNNNFQAQDLFLSKYGLSSVAILDDNTKLLQAILKVQDKRLLIDELNKSIEDAKLAAKSFSSSNDAASNAND